MMITPNRRSWITALAVAVLLMAPLRAQENPTDPIASVHAGPSRVEWLPQTDYERLTLTVTGPGDFAIQREFVAGKALSLDLFDEHDERLPEGSYAWELRTQPRLDAATREALAKARKAGDEVTVEKLRMAVRLPGRALVQTGYFTVENGSFAAADQESEHPEVPWNRAIDKETIPEDLVVVGDLIAQGGACIGDCTESVNYENLILKDEVVGLLFDDVDGSGRDWSIETNGISGPNRFSIWDHGSVKREVLTLSADAPESSLYIRSNGNLGLGTETPSQDVHVISTNSPAIRLEQVLGGGLSARSWDVLGNEVGFSIRDVTNSSAVPFRIRAGAPASSLEVSSSGNIGIGTATPASPLHVFGGATSDAFAGFGPNPDSTPAFNIGYAGATFGRSVGFLNVRSDASAVAPNPSLRFMTGNTERMIIDNEGFIGLGVANPTSPIHHSSGAALTAGGTWTNASSRAAKHDIRELNAEDARTALAGLAPVRFRYNAEPGDESLGFIAEDVPDLVATSDRKALSPMDIVAVLTKMVQEQERTIEDLSATVQQMRARLEEIEGQQP
jgi:hypothetical protein